MGFDVGAGVLLTGGVLAGTGGLGAIGVLATSRVFVAAGGLVAACVSVGNAGFVAAAVGAAVVATDVLTDVVVAAAGDGLPALAGVDVAAIVGLSTTVGDRGATAAGVVAGEGVVAAGAGVVTAGAGVVVGGDGVVAAGAGVCAVEATVGTTLLVEVGVRVGLGVGVRVASESNCAATVLVWPSVIVHAWPGAAAEPHA